MKMNKSEGKTITAHCPYCTGVLLKNARFEVGVSFKMPCPKPLSIKVEVEKIPHITAEIDES